MKPLIKADFFLFNDWTPYESGPGWRDAPSVPAYLVDNSTGRLYWNESKSVVSFKCALLAIGTPVVHATLGVGLKLLEVIKFSALREEKNTLKHRFQETGKDFAKLAFLPFGIVALEMASIYGIFSPYDGRKLYASLERAFYEGHLLAPCFQPDPNSHFFGGDPNQRNVF